MADDVEGTLRSPSLWIIDAFTRWTLDVNTIHCMSTPRTRSEWIVKRSSYGIAGDWGVIGEDEPVDGAGEPCPPAKKMRKPFAFNNLFINTKSKFYNLCKPSTSPLPLSLLLRPPTPPVFLRFSVAPASLSSLCASWLHSEQDAARLHEFTDRDAGHYLPFLAAQQGTDHGCVPPASHRILLTQCWRPNIVLIAP
jgi:hypothetical protein